jgi:hypothetical protein
MFLPGRAKTYTKRIKYHAAVHPERVEGQAKSGVFLSAHPKYTPAYMTSSVIYIW